MGCELGPIGWGGEEGWGEGVGRRGGGEGGVGLRYDADEESGSGRESESVKAMHVECQVM